MPRRLLAWSTLAFAAIAPQPSWSRPSGLLAAQSGATIAIRVSVLPSFRLLEAQAGEPLQMTSNAHALRYDLQVEPLTPNALMPSAELQQSRLGLPPEQQQDRQAPPRKDLLVLIVPD